jgi:hypothetical protein
MYVAPSKSYEIAAGITSMLPSIQIRIQIQNLTQVKSTYYELFLICSCTTRCGRQAYGENSNREAQLAPLERYRRGRAIPVLRTGGHIDPVILQSCNGANFVPLRNH